jgi:hypothetical protein
MRQGELERANVDELVRRYAELASIHGASTLAGDAPRTNRAAKGIAAIFRELRRRGLDAQRALLPLLSHDDLSVRSWAGAHALEFAPAEGEPALVRLAERSKDLVGFGAEIALREWRAGQLRFP